MITQCEDKFYSTRGFLIWRSPIHLQELEVPEMITLGREPGSAVPLQDLWISQRHCRIERKGRGFMLRDLRSRNGTFVNGTQVVEAWLQDGDQIRIGKTHFEFRWSPASPEPNSILESKNLFWQSQLQRLPNIAQSQFPVLISGPSGCGKDLLAQAIHSESRRRFAPFVCVNCCALSESLVESELFGHVRGSFTGATNNRKGAFEAARGGTLFLDEIGDLPLSLQPKLLRALENNQIRPVGSDKTYDTDVRIVTATHHDLKALVSSGRFRADLYFRLHVIQLQVPPLCERMEDFDALLYAIAREYRVRFSFAAIQTLKQLKWPGNIRELKNTVARAQALFANKEILERDLLQLVEEPLALKSTDGPPPARTVLKDIEIDMIKSRLIAHHGNQRKAAMDLGMPKSTLHDRLRAYGLTVAKILEEAKKVPGPVPSHAAPK